MLMAALGTETLFTPPHVLSYLHTTCQFCSEADLEVPISGLSALRTFIRFDNIFKLDLIRPSQHALTWTKNIGTVLYTIKILHSKVCWFQIIHFMMVVL